MKTEVVPVNLGPRSYPIYIGHSLLEQVGSLCSDFSPTKHCVVVGDSHTLPLYGKACQAALEQRGYKVSTWQFTSGELSKNLKTLSHLYDFLTQEKVERKSFLVALGGGVVGDLVGFAAATYLRGIPFVQIPTTLLAQVDSSVGGKTAVNLEGGKNLVGAFYQPKCVLCDVDLLKTLPARELSCGLSEVIKYGIILDAPFFDWLEKELPALLDFQPHTLTQAVQRCCQLKAQVTTQDECEGGKRAILNFGHTLAHAIEQVYGYGTYTHGEALSVGQLVACRLSEELLGFNPAETQRIKKLLERANLPTQIPADNVSQTLSCLIASTQHDKKASGGEPLFVLAEELGKVRFGCKVPAKMLSDILTEFVYQN